MPKYLLDTNCYLEASRRPPEAAALRSFSDANSPFLYLSSVVIAELLAGTPSLPAAERLRVEFIAPFARRRRIITPSASSWEHLGTSLAGLARVDGLVLRQVPRSFVADILLAASCRELGATLVTYNRRDANRISRVLPFSWVEPYPA